MAQPKISRLSLGAGLVAGIDSMFFSCWEINQADLLKFQLNYTVNLKNINFYQAQNKVKIF